MCPSLTLETGSESGIINLPVIRRCSMRIIARAACDVVVNEKKGTTATLVRGSIEGTFGVDGVAVGGMNIPFRVLSTKKSGESEYGPLWVAVDAWLKYDGGKSSFGPFGDDDLPQELKGLIDPDKVFELTDENNGFRLTIDVTDEGYTIVEKKHIGKTMISDASRERLSKISDKLAEAAAKNLEKKAKQPQQTEQQTRDEKRQERYAARNK